jgi:hypothetical protein
LPKPSAIGQPGQALDSPCCIMVWHLTQVFRFDQKKGAA